MCCRSDSEARTFRRYFYNGANFFPEKLFRHLRLFFLTSNPDTFYEMANKAVRTNASAARLGSASAKYSSDQATPATPTTVVEPGARRCNLWGSVATGTAKVRKRLESELRECQGLSCEHSSISRPRAQHVSQMAEMFARF